MFISLDAIWLWPFFDAIQPMSPTFISADPLLTESIIQIKMAYDPLCLLNCDKVVRVEKPKKGEVAEW